MFTGAITSQSEFALRALVSLHLAPENQNLSTEFFRKIIHNGRWTKIFATKCQGCDGPKFSDQYFRDQIFRDQNFRSQGMSLSRFSNVHTTWFVGSNIVVENLDLSKCLRRESERIRTFIVFLVLGEGRLWLL